MNDDELLASLRHAVESTDDVPATLRDAALRAHTWDRDMALMLDSPEMPALRSGTEQMDFAFVLDGHEIYFSAEPQANGKVRVFGAVLPRANVVTILPVSGEPIDFTTTASGRFDFEIPHLSLAIGFEASGQLMRTPVVTV